MSGEYRAESDEERVNRRQLAAVDPWGYLTTTSRDITVYTQATLRHFDNKVRGRVKTGPLIPWIRRLAKTEISEFQEATSWSRFGNRDYDRPFLNFLVTLRGFD